MSVGAPARAAPPATGVGGPRFAVVVPTYNESKNLPALVDKVRSAFGAAEDWELVFVDDDSADGTAALARELAQTDRRIRCVQRVGRRGLASAVIEGALATTAPLIAVMDADLQHDETLLPKMREALESGAYDLVVGSRYVDGGDTGEWADDRVRVSKLGTRLAQVVLRANVSDPMSGFFAMTRPAFEASLPNLSSIGFKILFDLIASAPQRLRLKELPYVFGTRRHGDSKLDLMTLWEFLLLVVDKKIGHIVPARFLSFAAVGGSGVVVHFATLSALYLAAGASFAWAQGIATFIAITWNFVLNNTLTYRDRRLTGWGFVRGWLVFVLVCSLGAGANVGIANWLYEADTSWVWSSLAGIAVGSVWNYAMASAYAWRPTRRKRRVVG